MNHYLHFMENESEKCVCYCGFCKFKDLKKSQEVYFEIVQGVLYHHLFIEEETEDQSKNLLKATQSCDSHPSLWVLSHFSHVWLFVTLWTAACQAPLFMGFSRQGYWSGLPFPSPGDLPQLGVELGSLKSPALAGGFFTTSATLVGEMNWTLP